VSAQPQRIGRLELCDYPGRDGKFEAFPRLIDRELIRYRQAIRYELLMGYRNDNVDETCCNSMHARCGIMFSHVRES
jgi:hypothetical protein